MVARKASSGIATARSSPIRRGLANGLKVLGLAEGKQCVLHVRPVNSDLKGAEAAANEAQAPGVKAIAVGADLRDDAAVTNAVEGVERDLGPIAVLVNNAAATRRQPFLESTAADWASQVDVTVSGTLRITHAVARRMAARRAP